MKLLLTGASGFIGQNVLLRAPREWEIVAVHHRTSGLDAFVKAHSLTNVRVERCDLLDTGAYAAAYVRVEAGSVDDLDPLLEAATIALLSRDDA